MIVIMKPGCTPTDVQHVVSLLQELGLNEHVSVGTDLTIIGAIGGKRHIDLTAIENAPMVDRLMRILAPYKIASREVHAAPSQVRLGPGATIGGRAIGIIAGPCSVESEKQLMTNNNTGGPRHERNRRRR